MQPRIWSVHKYSAAGSETVWLYNPIFPKACCLIPSHLWKHWQPSLSPPTPPCPHCISIYFQNWFISLCLLSGSLILTLQISKIIGLSLVFSSSRKPLNVLSIPLNSSLHLSALDPLILLLCQSLDRNSSSVTQCLNTASPPCFNTLSVLYNSNLQLQHIRSFDKPVITKTIPQHYNVFHKNKKSNSTARWQKCEMWVPETLSYSINYASHYSFWATSKI